ncbi:MAG: hypothetical protein J6C77_04640 [Muribaculaceae bacterium]|nr:hypothetical protein [Muribaculaceae bacterium]
MKPSATKTLVMATLTPGRCTPDMLRGMRKGGMAGVRINSAHADASTLRGMVADIRSIDPAISILVDTKGPELRTTAFAPPRQELNLTPGREISICEGMGPSDSTTLYLPVAGIEASLRRADEILIDDGAIKLRRIGPAAGGITAHTVTGGLLGSHKTVALPGVTLPPMPAVTDADRRSIEAAREAGIDIIAHSFVRSAADVLAVRELLQGTSIQLYAKIETAEALADIAEIARVADGLLVARGDLGTQIPLETIPEAQYRIASEAWRRGKPLMISTQILHSMESAPAPSRAELSDIALAVMERATWVLLCGETARGDHPRECVLTASRTIEQVTGKLPYVVG